MCVIMAKTENYRDVDKVQKYLENMVNGNPDGNGIVVIEPGEHGKIWWKKGISPNELYRLAKQNINKTFFIHTRIGTSGEMTAPYTHPFLISTHRDHKKILEGTLKAGEFLLLHNGMFSIKIMDGESDTSTVAKFLSHSATYWDKNFDKLSQFFDIFGNSSRVLFINSEGKIGMTGNWVQEEEGLLFSNSNYKWSYRYYGHISRSSTGYSSYTGYSSGFGYEEADTIDEDEDYFLEDILSKLNIHYDELEYNINSYFSFQEVEKKMLDSVVHQVLVEELIDVQNTDDKETLPQAAQ